MLHVKTYLDKSSIEGAGMGCFASEFIPKGSLIWALNPMFDKIYTEDNLKSMTDLELKFVKTYAYKYKGMYYLCMDNARFFNHSSSNPNTWDPITEHKTYAAKDIMEGEEILSDYSTFGVESDLEHNMDDL